MKIGSGTVYRNKKRKTVQSPDVVGEILIRGERIKVSGWKRETPEVHWFLSFSNDEVGSISDEIISAFGGTEIDLREVAKVIRSESETTRNQDPEIGKKSA